LTPVTLQNTVYRDYDANGNLQTVVDTLYSASYPVDTSVVRGGTAFVRL